MPGDEPTVEDLDRLDPAEVERITRADEVLADLSLYASSALDDIREAMGCLAAIRREQHIADMFGARLLPLGAALATAQRALDNVATTLRTVRRG